MALSVTLSYLIESSRQQADMVNSKFVADQWITNRINSHVASLYDKLVAKGEDYYTVARPFVVDGSSDNYALPSDFYKLLAVDYKSGGQTTQMQPFMFNERDKYNVTSARIPAQTLTLWIVPAITKLILANRDTDALDGVNGWEDWVIYNTARDMLIKQESPTSEVDGAIGALDKRIEAMSSNRNIGAGERIKDVTGRGTGYPFYSQISYRYRVIGSKIYFIGTDTV